LEIKTIITDNDGLLTDEIHQLTKESASSGELNYNKRSNN
jgi:hypothetical protein